MTYWDIITKVANDDAAIRRQEMAAEESRNADSEEAKANNTVEVKEEK